MPPKLRVLIDLSMAARGYCGIAQEARLLYKVLASSPDVEVTGLVYHPRNLSAPHKFLSSNAPRADRVANQAAFLWALAEGAITWPNVRPLRALKKLQSLATTLRASRAQLDQLDPQAFGDLAWRLLFGRTLSPTDIELVRGGEFLLSNISNGMMYARAFTGRRPFKLDTRGYDYFIVQGPRPFRPSPGTRQIVRYHDMIPMLQPDTMSNPLAIKWHHRAIRQCPESAFFVCNSGPTRDELTTVYPELTKRSATLPYMLSAAYWPDSQPGRVDSIIDMRRSAKTGAPTHDAVQQCKYILSVSTLEPRKNFLGLIEAFNALKFRGSTADRASNLKLVVVGSPGWKCEPILSAMRKLVERGELIHLENVPADELRVLYTHAEAFVFPSIAEGFGFPPLEAMLCDTPVVASDIAAHRWVLGDAALFCNPYDPSSFATALVRLVCSDESASLRKTLVARGRQRVQAYSFERCSQQWIELLERLKANAPINDTAAPSGSHEASLLERVA